MFRKIGFIAILGSLGSLGWACKKDYIDGPAGTCSAYIPKSEGPTAEESAKWVSDEKPPKHPESACDRGEINCMQFPDDERAKGERPASCDQKCVWTGTRCLCNEDKDAGKKP